MEVSSWKEHSGIHDQFLGGYNRNIANRGHCQNIQHPISKLDTLAGIAIKYGVEVADIKKMNGLVTDSQMFAHNTLHIPPHGRHPPSPCFPNGSSPTGQDNPDSACFELFESCHSLKRKSSEEKLPSQIKKSASEVFSMVEYKKRASEDGSVHRKSLMSRRQKSRSLANETLDDIIATVVEGGEGDTLVKGHQSEANLPGLLLKQDNSSRGGFRARSAKGLALRQKSGSRTSLTMHVV
ncbi:hypothetical protein RJT34_31724 [Clitoria ternatea]|uniref:LysM domain-containing protein n=1 Tax=Clitoria ternatea TaxID=43366 RepID=A0AAN9EZ06_CLITE